MKKREFAAKLLFWLLPWPISKALPRSLRIYYFGPAGGPPPGFYDYWGTPGEFWPDMYTPPDPENFPEPPAGPSNPSDPYTPGPGPVNPHPPIASGAWAQYLDDTYWETDEQASWNVDHWDFEGDYGVSIKPLGTWADGFRPSKMRITHDYGAGLDLILANDGEPGWAFNGEVISGTEYALDFSGYADGDILYLWHDAGEEGCDFDITNIEFFS